MSPERRLLNLYSTDRRVVALRGAGYVVCLRDPKMNTAFRGKYMVAADYEVGHTQADGSGGVWCIVGDNLSALVEDAYNTFCCEV